MSASLPTQPAMTYAPHHHHHARWSQDRTSPEYPQAASLNPQMLQSPFKTPIASPVVPAYVHRHNSSFDSARHGALSDGSFSPSRSSFDASPHHVFRDSMRSNRSEPSHLSAFASPRPAAFNAEARRQDRYSDTLSSVSSRTKSQGHGTIYWGQRAEEEERLALEGKALKILIYLSSFNILTSIIVLIYTIFALLFIILIQPLRFCTKRTTFRQQVIDLLSPTLKIQLGFVYSCADNHKYNVPLLVVVSIFSAVVSMGVAVAACVAGAFWFFNAILGDPAASNGTKGDNDGRASVIGVRRWWERWLTRALK